MEQSDEGEKIHPPYMIIWGVLALLMFAKVGVSMMQMPRWFSVALLVVISLVSALLVALYYMHLRFEPRRLKLVVLAPIPLVIILVLIMYLEYV